MSGRPPLAGSCSLDEVVRPHPYVPVLIFMVGDTDSACETSAIIERVQRSIWSVYRSQSWTGLFPWKMLYGIDLEGTRWRAFAAQNRAAFAHAG